MSTRQYILLVVSLFLSIATAYPDNFPSDEFEIIQKQIQYIYDGDTFYLVCDNCNKGQLGVRIMGVDTAELRGKCSAEIKLAKQAKKFSVQLLRNANKILIQPNKSRRYDRYGRLLAWVNIDGLDLGQALISNDLGRMYQGGKRQTWCD